MRSIENNKDKKKKVLKVVGLVGLFLLVFGLSYALFRITLTGRKKTRISTASFNLELLDKNNNDIKKTDNNEYEYEINLENAVPEEDESGLAKEGFVFKLRNSGSIAAKYTIYLDDVELEQGEERILDKYVKYSLTKNETVGTPALLSSLTERALDTGIINNGVTNEYELKIWIDEEAGIEASNKVFNTVLKVKGEQYISKMKIKSGTFADTLVKQGIVDSITQVSGNGFDSSKETDGLYDYTDSEGTETYVYRGINPNNYVTFAGSTWRVLRIQEDGTVKLIKEDALNFESDKVAGDTGSYKIVKYNNSESSDEDSKYEGSNVKAYVEEWYSSKMSSYDNKIVTNSYCSDRTEDHNSVFYKMMGSQYQKLYGVLNRIFIPGWDGQSELSEELMAAMAFIPSVSCRNEDKVNTKVALIDADEFVLVGGSFNSADHYLKKDYFSNTMSPAGYEEGNILIYFTNAGAVAPAELFGAAVHPVITLKATTTISAGNGTSAKPYVID